METASGSLGITGTTWIRLTSDPYWFATSFATFIDSIDELLKSICTTMNLGGSFIVKLRGPARLEAPTLGSYFSLVLTECFRIAKSSRSLGRPKDRAREIEVV